MKIHFAIMLAALAVIVVSGAVATFAQTSDPAGNTTGNETELADNNANVTVTPFAQVPGGSVLIEANGLAPNANTTIIVDDGVAAKSETDENGTLLYALGVPDQIVITEIRVDNSTGDESVRNITRSWDGTVSVVVRDQFDNDGAAELTVIKPIGQPGNATGS